jgi:carboxypeptidase Taq
MKAEDAYQELLRRSRELTLLASCEELLGWDELTYMPHAGVVHRGNQMALLAGLNHQRATHPRIGELLEAVEGSALVHDAESPPAVNVRELRRVYERLVRLPRTLVEETARLTTLTQQAWSEARARNQYEHFRPWLQKIVALKRREAECYRFDTVPYDALLEDYEPGVRSQDLVRIFDALRHELVPLVWKITAEQRPCERSFLRREYPLDRQRIYGEAVAAGIGFDFQCGRLDTSVHPFSSHIGPGDSRITTRYQLHEFSVGFFSILHEVGHALYEQGLAPEHYGTPMGEAVSLGLHESQARLWDNTVGHSRAFWQHFFPLARQVFHGALHDVTLDTFYRAINYVAPSALRIRADEVTYNLHILIRFELEQALIQGDLPVDDVPAAWSEAYRRYLGIVPANDAEGCLQDGHWGSGLIGYFPTYTLGNLFAAQLFAKATEDLGDLSEAFADGDFGPVLEWLRAHVYRHGSRYPALQLIERVTGTPLSPRFLIQALARKHQELSQTDRLSLR